MKFSFKLTTTVLAVVLSVIAFSQEFEGVIKYKISYGVLPPEVEMFKSMLPKHSKMTIKGEKTRMEQASGLMGSSVIISDSKKNTSTALMDAMGMKYYMTLPSAPSSSPTINYTNDTKDIAGYKCKSAEMSIPGSNDIMVVYYTTEITAKAPQGMETLKGFPLEYKTISKGLKLTMTATNVEKKKIDNSKFEIPEGYTKTTQQELKQKLGGAM